jgi:hypothetical protein
MSNPIKRIKGILLAIAFGSRTDFVTYGEEELMEIWCNGSSHMRMILGREKGGL